MANRRKARARGWLERMARAVTHWSGTSQAFGAAFAVVIVWALLGPVFHFSDTWQLVINTGTTVVTFLMVFLIQRAQNKGTLAVQLKLNELVASIDAANNRLISVEDLSDDELDVLHNHYRKLAEMAKRDAPVADTHSEEQARARHHRKRKRREGTD